MKKSKQIENDVRIDVREKFLEVLGDSFNDIDNEELIDYAVDNVFETSGIEDEGIYNMADVNLAIQRTIPHYINNFNKIESPVNSLTQSILEETTDYDWLNLSTNETDIIFERTENIYDRDDVELTINKSLLEFGYEFNPEYLKWINTQ